MEKPEFDSGDYFYKTHISFYNWLFYWPDQFFRFPIRLTKLKNDQPDLVPESSEGIKNGQSELVLKSSDEANNIYSIISNKKLIKNKKSKNIIKNKNYIFPKKNKLIKNKNLFKFRYR